jgi:hypothetical protein
MNYLEYYTTDKHKEDSKWLTDCIVEREEKGEWPEGLVVDIIYDNVGDAFLIANREGVSRPLLVEVDIIYSDLEYIIKTFERL